MNFRGLIEKQAVIIQVPSMDDVPALQLALSGKHPIHYEYQGVRYTVTGNAPVAKPAEKPATPAPKGVESFLPPPVPALVKTILDLHSQGKGHNVQDLINIHLKRKFPDKRGQMGNVYIQWVRRAQAARLRIEENHGVRFELQGAGNARHYVGRAAEE